MNNKWISVKDKPPLWEGTYLVHDTNGSEYKALFHGKHWHSVYPCPIKEWLEETEEPNSISNESIDEELEAEAEKSAINAGYIQSDEEVFESTLWTLHNVFKEGYKVGKNHSATPNEMVGEDENIKGLKLDDGFYYHYTDVCTLARRYHQSKIEELEEWIDEQEKKAETNDYFIYAPDLMDKIKSL